MNSNTRSRRDNSRDITGRTLALFVAKIVALVLFAIAFRVVDVYHLRVVHHHTHGLPFWTQVFSIR